MTKAANTKKKSNLTKNGVVRRKRKKTALTKNCNTRTRKRCSTLAGIKKKRTRRRRVSGFSKADGYDIMLKIAGAVGGSIINSIVKKNVKVPIVTKIADYGGIGAIVGALLLSVSKDKKIKKLGEGAVISGVADAALTTIGTFLTGGVKGIYGSQAIGYTDFEKYPSSAIGYLKTIRGVGAKSIGVMSKIPHTDAYWFELYNSLKTTSSNILMKAWDDIGNNVGDFKCPEGYFSLQTLKNMIEAEIQRRTISGYAKPQRSIQSPRNNTMQIA